ncbi:MAG: type 1 glutamine amidotransferase [Legionella sp.]|nr:type 1 glutamine amidotransferase [Legionella sp.]
MNHSPHGKRVAILVANGFEQVEMTKPRQALEQAGFATTLVSPETDKVKGWNSTQWGEEFPVDLVLKDADANQFDTLLLPGGVINPDALRINDQALKFIKDFHEQKKPIAAICHAPWLFINTGIAQGLRLTSWASVKTDLVNAGAQWLDQETVIDGHILTSRKPDDIPAFNKAMVQLFSN